MSYDPPIAADDPALLTACGETMAVVRKKALLRILARSEANRRSISVTDNDVEATFDWFRRCYGLSTDNELSRWMECQKLTKTTFAIAMRDFTLVRLVEEAYKQDIDELVPDQIAISTARLRSSV